MSCYVMSKHETLAIASFIAKKRNEIHYYQLFSIASELFKINVQSVNSRYNRKERFSNVKFYDFEVNPYNFDAIPTSHQARLIDCYLYQIDNKEGYEKIKIIVELQKLRDELQFIESHYYVSEWGLSENNTPRKKYKSHKTYWNSINGYRDSHIMR